MSLYVNTVEVEFESDCFGGSVMLSRLSVESRSPTWKKVDDLRLTRASDPGLHQVIFYKEVSCQLLRIEASDHSATERRPDGMRNRINSPLRLILPSGGKCRIVVKKSTKGQYPEKTVTVNGKNFYSKTLVV